MPTGKNRTSRRGSRGSRGSDGRLATLQRAAFGLNVDGVPDGATAVDIPAEQRPFEDLLKSTLWRSVTFFRGGLVQTRLSCRRGSIEEKYMRYCFNVSPTALDYGEQKVRSTASDTGNQQRFKRRLLNSILPTDLPTDLPTNLDTNLATNQPTTGNNPTINSLNAAVNQENKQKNRENAAKNLANRRKNVENQKKNQANYLLEMRIRTTVRRLLAEVKPTEYWRDTKVFERLMTDTLVALEDPDVQWASYSDIYIAAGLVIYQEGALQEIFSHKSGFTSRLNDDEARQRDPHTAYPVMRTSVNLGKSFVVLPNQHKYYVKPKVDSPVDNDSGNADSASDGSSHHSAAGEVPQEAYLEPTPLKGRAGGAAAGEAVPRKYLEPVVLPGAVVAASGEEVPVNYDNQNGDGTLAMGPDGMAVNAGFGFNGSDDEEGDDEHQGYLSVAATPAGSMRGKPAMRETSFAAGEGGDASPPDAVVVAMTAGEEEEQGYDLASPGNAGGATAGEEEEQGYDLASPGNAGGATAGEEEEQGYDLASPGNAGNATAGEEDTENYVEAEDEGHSGTPPRAARSRAATATAAPVATKPNKPLPTRFGEPDCLGTIVEQTRRNIRYIFNGESNVTIADLVRDTAAGHLGESADKEQKAIRAIAELAMQEMLAVSGFNAFQVLGIPDAVFDDLHKMLMRFVDFSQMSYASKQGSVPSAGQKATLFNGFDQLIPVMNAFARLYLQQVAQYLKDGKKPPQIFLLEKRDHDSEKRRNYHVVVDNGVSRNLYYLNEHYNKEDPVTRQPIQQYLAFEQSRKSFKSIDSEDVGKNNPPEVSTYGSTQPYCHTFLDKDNNGKLIVHDVIAVCTLNRSALDKLSKVKESIVAGIADTVITENLFDMISKGALQQAYNRHDDYAIGERAKRWIAMHPYHWGLPLVGLAVVAAGIGAAAAVGAFDGPAPCEGYSDTNGACVAASALPAATTCSYEVLSSNLDEGGVVRLQPRCQLGDVQASAMTMQINNIPAGAVVTANGKTLEVVNGAVDVSEYINIHEVHVDMPDGFNTLWTPEASFSIESGTLSKAGSHSAAGAVTFTPIAQTATVSTSGTFIVNENADQAFTVTLTPGPGDSGAKLFARNMAVGDQLCGVDVNGDDVCIEATALGQTHELPFARDINNQIAVTYKPAEHSAGVKSFELFGKSIDSTLNGNGDVVEVEGAESVPQSVTFSVNPVATAPFNTSVPASIYAVEGEFSEPFTIRAETHDPVLNTYLVLQPGAAVRGTLAADNSTVTIENTGSTPQQFDVSSWNDDSFQNRGGGIFDVVFESVHGTETQTLQEEPGFQVFELPTFQITDTDGNVLSGLNCTEDQVCGPFVVHATPDAGAVSGTVEVTLPTVNTPFAGHFALNGTLADGTAVTAPGPTIDVSGWRLNDPSAPLTITPIGDSGQLNVNSANTPGLALGISGSYQDANGNTASNSYSAPISIAPVADDFTFTGSDEVANVPGGGGTIFGALKTDVPGETLEDYMVLTAPPEPTFYDNFKPFTNPTFFPKVVNNSDGTFSAHQSLYNQFGLVWTLPAGTPSPQSKEVNATACVNDGNDQLCKTRGFRLVVN